MRVRAGREADVRAIELLVRDAFSAETDRLTMARVDADYATLVSALGVRVAVTDDAVIGVLVLWPHPDHLLVETVAVLPAAQGAGVATLLLEVAEREALAAGVGELRLSANSAMAQSLTARGWVEIRRAAEGGFDRVYLVKRVA